MKSLHSTLKDEDVFNFDFYRFINFSSFFHRTRDIVSELNQIRLYKVLLIDWICCRKYLTCYLTLLTTSLCPQRLNRTLWMTEQNMLLQLQIQHIYWSALSIFFLQCVHLFVLCVLVYFRLLATMLKLNDLFHYI